MKTMPLLLPIALLSACSDWVTREEAHARFDDTNETCENPEDFYPDADGDGYGDSTADAIANCDSLDGLVTDNTDCDDNSAFINPEARELREDGIDNDCSGAADDGFFEGTVYLASELVLSLQGDEQGAMTGYALRFGDLDGDGFAEAIIGAPGQSYGGDESGSVHVLAYEDVSTSVGQHQLMRHYGQMAGENSGDSLGTALAVNDLDGDGIDDLAALAENGGSNGTGAVYVATGLTELAAYESGEAFSPLIVDNPDTELLLGDIAIVENLSGTGSLAVSYPEAEDGAGIVAILPYAKEPIPLSFDGTTNVMFMGANSGDQAGALLAAPGDIDGDGVFDLLVGAPDFDCNITADDSGDLQPTLRCGAVHLVSGPFSSGTIFLADTPTITGFGSLRDPADKIFSDVSAAGDIDGDGHDDFLIADDGKVYLIAGRSDDAWPEDLNGASAVISDASGGTLLVADTAGDLDGDGHADVTVSNPDYDATEGAIYLYYGDTMTGEQDITNAAATLNGQPYSFAGSALAGAGDMDGDGQGDLLIGAPGSSAGGESDAGAAYLLMSTRLE